MKICISSLGKNLDAKIDPRFGQSQHFVILDLDTMEFKIVNNSAVMASGGVGVSTAQLMVNEGVEIVITGNCGPKAYRTLSAGGIKVVIGASGTVKRAIDEFRSGKLQVSSKPNVSTHFGRSIDT